MDLLRITRILKLSSCLFTGCSYTEGHGLELVKDDPDLWCNILHKTHKDLNNSNIINLAKNGSNNTDIFCQTIEGLIEHQPKFAFVCWSEHYRCRLNPGLETYDTGIFVSANCPIEFDVELNDKTYSNKYINDIKNRFFDLQNIHYTFLEILNYCRILSKTANSTKTKIYFINGICDWDENYFNHITNGERRPHALTPLTKKILHVDNRDDDEIFKIYDKMHQTYSETQGLVNWLNLYQGFRTHFYLDKGNDNIHPGIVSHKQFAKFLLGQF